VCPPVIGSFREDLEVLSGESSALTKKTPLCSAHGGKKALRLRGGKRVGGGSSEETVCTLIKKTYVAPPPSVKAKEEKKTVFCEGVRAGKVKEKEKAPPGLLVKGRRGTQLTDSPAPEKKGVS